MAGPTELLECPLCDFTVLPSDDYILQLHFEQVHTTDSPFRIEHDPEPLPPALPPRPSPAQSSKQADTNAPTSGEEDEDENSVLCPEPDCGEIVALTDFNDHLDFHAAETLSFDEDTREYHSRRSGAASSKMTASSKPSFLEQNFSTELPEALRRGEDAGRKLKKKTLRGRSDTSRSDKSTLSRSILSFNPFARSDKKVKPPASSCRLGREELGPYAWEERMPRWLHDQLAAGPKITLVNRIGRDGRLIKQEQVQNETPGIIPILAQLSALDRTVKEAYYCHPCTVHIGRTPREGGFCGYRNIQMLLSYIQGSKAQGHEEFPGRTPGILKLQNLIERAWDRGVNEIGRQQTGGIKDTRKYIGTPEAQALFISSQIDCAVQIFSDSPDGSVEAHEQLLDAVERYFSKAAVSDGSNVYKTLLPPIYLQQPGHSITIIGFERRRDGTCNLMIFDPMYSTSPAMHRLIGRKNIRTARPEVLYAYRRVAKQLRKHAGFETLMLTAHPPLFPAWDVLRQFPDCRFLYTFFRSRTLGYDVYPEDLFLRNFPWQEYGGLWILDDARFARSESIDPITAQALRRITGEGISSSSSSNNSMSSPLESSSMHQPHSPVLHNVHSTYSTRPPPVTNSFDGSPTGLAFNTDNLDINAMLDALGMHTMGPSINTASAQQAKLSLLTDVGRRYPGYPSPLSPTFDAKHLWPSPLSEAGSDINTPRASSPALLIGSPMSISGLDMSWSSPCCASQSYEQYASTMGLSPTSEDCSQHENASYVGKTFLPEARNGSQLHSPPRSPSITSLSPTSPPSAISPRTAMLKNMIEKQALQSLYHQPQLNTSTSPPLIYPANATRGLLSPPASPTSPLYAHYHMQPAIPIANGFLTSSSTFLSYKSNRGADSGLLAVRPLTETHVAEYRFWRPCGRRSCAFGCGEGDEGEKAAARRLFRSEEAVGEDGDDETGMEHGECRCVGTDREQMKGVGDREREWMRREAGLCVV